MQRPSHDRGRCFFPALTCTPPALGRLVGRWTARLPRRPLPPRSRCRALQKPAARFARARGCADELRCRGRPGSWNEIDQTIINGPAGLEFHGSLFISNPATQQCPLCTISQAFEDKDVFDSTGTQCNSYVLAKGTPGNLKGLSTPYSCPTFNTTYASGFHTYKARALVPALKSRSRSLAPLTLRRCTIHARGRRSCGHRRGYHGLSTTRFTATAPQLPGGLSPCGRCCAQTWARRARHWRFPTLLCTSAASAVRARPFRFSCRLSDILVTSGSARPPLLMQTLRWTGLVPRLLGWSLMH